MQVDDETKPTVLRLFEVRAKPGCAEALLEKFETTSVEVVRDAPGNAGWFFGKGAAGDEDLVVFASLWRDMDAVRTRFGEAWRESFLPTGYDDLIEEHRVRHVDVGGGWHVAASG